MSTPVFYGTQVCSMQNENRILVIKQQILIIICLLRHEGSTVKYKHTDDTHTYKTYAYKTYTIKETTNMHPVKPQKRVSLYFLDCLWLK